MNTNFIDMSASVSNLPQNGFNPAGAEGVGSGKGSGQAAEKTRGFEDQFQEEISRLETIAERGTKKPGPGGIILLKRIGFRTILIPRRI